MRERAGTALPSARQPAPNTGKSERLRCVTWRMRSCGATTPVFFVCTRCFGELRPAFRRLRRVRHGWKRSCGSLWPRDRRGRANLRLAEARRNEHGHHSPRRSYLPAVPTDFFQHPILREAGSYQNGGQWDWFAGPEHDAETPPSTRTQDREPRWPLLRGRTSLGGAPTMPVMLARWPRRIRRSLRDRASFQFGAGRSSMSPEVDASRLRLLSLPAGRGRRASARSVS